MGAISKKERRLLMMAIKMKELPISERPYEKLEMYGENTLSNAELLAIIIKSGTKEESSVMLAQRILSLEETRKFAIFTRIVHTRPYESKRNR